MLERSSGSSPVEVLAWCPGCEWREGLQTTREGSEVGRERVLRAYVVHADQAHGLSTLAACQRLEAQGGLIHIRRPARG